MSTMQTKQNAVGLPRQVTLHRIIAAVLLAVSVAVIVLALFQVQGTVRLLVVTAFSVAAPGWAIVAFWRPATLAMEWTVSVCLSLAVTIVVAMTMLVLSAWYPVPIMITLAVLTAGALIFHLLRTDLADWPTA